MAADPWAVVSERPEAPPQPRARSSPAATQLGGATAPPPPPEPRAPQASAAAAQQADPWAVVEERPATGLDVGFLESAGRTFGSAVVPVVQAGGIMGAAMLTPLKNAAAIADTLAPVFGVQSDLSLRVRDLQDRLVFDQMRRAQESMRGMYAPKPGEEFDTAGKVVGAVASIAPEVLGGMGVQRGIGRAVDVIDAGGDMGQAATAGIVSGAANVAANLLPVKAGGAAARAVERGLAGAIERTGAQRVAGKVAGGATGAATGGAMGIGGDILVTAAENASLPEGEQFKHLERKIDPAMSGGLGAGLGLVAGAVGAPMPRVRASVAPPTVPRGAEAPAGSVGAAGADPVTARRERAAALPHPIALSEGKANPANFEAARELREGAKREGKAGDMIREEDSEANERMLKNFEQFVEDTGAQQASPEGAGRAITDPILAKAAAAKKQINEAYKAAEDAGETAELVPYSKITAYIGEKVPGERANSPVINVVEQLLERSDPAKTGEVSLKDLDEIRKKVRASTTFGTPDSVTGGQIIKLIDESTEGRGGEIYGRARKLYRDYAAEFKNQGVIRDLIGLKKGTTDRKVAFEDVLRRVVDSGTLDDLRNVERTLKTAGEGGVQAWRELQGAAMRRIHEAATRNTSRDQRGNPIVSAAGLDKAIKALDADGKLEQLFGKKGAEQLRDLNDIAKDIYVAPPGTVNTSSTAAVLAKIGADWAASTAVTGIPLPLLSLLKGANTLRKERAEVKKVAKLLGPRSQDLPVAPQPAERFKTPDVQAPPAAPAPAAPAPKPLLAKTPAAPPQSIPRGEAREAAGREAELLKLRGEATAPGVQAYLDKQIAAERKRADDAKAGAEFLRLADETPDAALREQLETKAAALGVRREPIPTGEARELTGEDAEVALAEGKPVPAGEAVELDAMTLQAIDAEWAAASGLGRLDQDRAKRVEQALLVDQAAVRVAAIQYAKSPVAFDRAIGDIISKGQSDAGKQQGTSERGGGPDAPEGGSEGEGGAPVVPRKPGGGDQGGGAGGAAPGGGQAGGPKPAAAAPDVGADAPGDQRSGMRARQIAEGAIKIDTQPGLSAAERAIEQRFTEAVRSDLDGFIARYVQLPDTRGGKIVNTDEARELWHEYAADNDSRALNARAVHEPARTIAKEQYRRLLAAHPVTGKVMLLGGGGGSGKTSSIDGIEPGFVDRFDAIFDTTLSNEDTARRAIEQALTSGREVVITFTSRDPLDSIVNGVIKRAKTKGRTVRLDIAARAHEEAPRVLQTLRERYVDDPRVSFQFVDNTGGPGRAKLAPEPSNFSYNDIEGRAMSAARKAYEQGEISEAVFRGLGGQAQGEGGQGLRGGQERPGGEGAGRQPEPQRGSGQAGAAAQAGQAVEQAPAGGSGVAVTERGLEVPFTYKLVDADELITSHDNDLRPNPAFDQRLQPRDRQRQSSEEQIARMAGDIRPDLLGANPKASDGAPIIGKDGMVESGNARTIALRRAYEDGNAERYRAWLAEHAGEFGFTPEQVRGMRRPVLVRVGQGDYDRAEFARQANEASVARLSTTEQAASDAARMPDLDGLVLDDDGNVNRSRSADWIRDFVRLAVGPSERNAFMTGQGDISQTGMQRIRNAVFQKAYGDAELVAMLTESPDSNVQNVLKGLLRAAGDVARVRDLQQAGARGGDDYVPDLVEAVRRYAKARADGMRVDDVLAQATMFGGEASPRVAQIMRGMELDARAPRRIGEAVREMARQIDAAGDPRQGMLMEPKAQYLSDDLAKQQRFLEMAARDAGHDSLDAWVAADLPGFMRAADEWREANPVDELREDLLSLAPQTADDLRAKAEREAAGTAAAAAAQRKTDLLLRRRDDQAEARARADATVDAFQLGQSADQQLSGQGDLLNPPDAPSPKPPTVEPPAPAADTTPYAVDLFGDPVAPPKAAARRAAAAPPAAGGLGEAQAPDVPPGTYATRTAPVVTRQQQLGHAGPVRSAGDAANALAYLSRSAVERLDGLVLDANNTPIGVIGGFKGGLSQTNVYPATLLGEALQMPRARKVWLVHNHPSGVAELSSADKNLGQSLARTFDGIGITVEGVIAVTPDGWSSMSSGGASSDGPTRPVDGGPSVPAQERQIVQHGPLDFVPIESPARAKALAKHAGDANGGKPVVILLDSQNRPIAMVPWAAEDAMPLKGNGKLTALLRAAAHANAGAAIIATGSDRPMSLEQAQNIGAGLARMDVRALDIIDSNGTAATERGWDTTSRAVRSLLLPGSVAALAAAAALAPTAAEASEEQRENQAQQPDAAPAPAAAEPRSWTLSFQRDGESRRLREVVLVGADGKKIRVVPKLSRSGLIDGATIERDDDEPATP